MSALMLASIKGMPRLKHQLQRYPVFLKEQQRMILHKHARSLISSSGNIPGVIQITPPHSKGKRGKSAKEQGQMAITADLLGLKGGRSKHQRTAGAFVVMKDELLSQNAKIYASQSQNVRLFVRKNGDVYGTDRQHFRPNASTAEMYAHHQSLRRKSDGRVMTAGGATRDVGRWKFIDQMVVSRSAYLRYERMIHRRVGMLAATLLSIYDGKFGPLKGVPAWISRHNRGWGNGSIQERLTAHGEVIRLELDAGSLNGEMQRRFTAALGYRVNAMKKDIPHALRAAAKSAGLLK